MILPAFWQGRTAAGYCEHGENGPRAMLPAAIGASGKTSDGLW
jgi:hypothetical protein